jgi:two-component system response regulator
MNGLELVEHLRNRGEQLPILMISATENMADIAKALRLGVQDVLLKPVKDFDRLRETVYACLYPNMFNSRVEEEERLFEDWDALVSNPTAASRLLQEFSRRCRKCHCRIHYRQLVSADKPGLVLDIAPLSENDLAFYCLDVTRAGDNGVLAHYCCARCLMVAAGATGASGTTAAGNGQFVKTGEPITASGQFPGSSLCWWVITTAV